MVEFLDPAVLDGISRAFSLEAVMYCTLGVTLGMFVGVLPGIGILPTIALLIPFTFYLEPMTGIAMLAGIYYGAAYGGSTASILLNMPGTANTAVTCLDGYPMAQQGRSGVALFITTIASFVGSILGIVILAAFAFPLAELALRFGSQEYFALMVLGLVAASLMSSTTPSKSLAMVVFGLVLGIVGIDVTSGVPRFTFGIIQFYDGISLIAIALGLFGLSELIRNSNAPQTVNVTAQDIKIRSMIPTADDWKRSIPAMLRGTGVGSVFGPLPGTGSTIAAFVSYALERRVNARPERFGKGAIEGISGPEAANNAAIQTAFIPTLTLGIPGDAVMALMIGVLMIHGIAPGPQLMTNDPGMFWGLIATFLFGNVVLLFLNIPLIGLWVRILSIPYSILFPAVMGFLCIGVYSVSYSVIDLYVLLALGIAGYFLIYCGFPIAPILLGLILGPMLEENFRRALLVQRGDFMGFFYRPISGTLLILTAVILIAALAIEARRMLRARRQ